MSGAPESIADKLAALRVDFSIKDRRCYFNNASVGALSNRVVAAVTEFLGDVRDHGRNSYPRWCETAENDIKGRAARLIGARPDEIAFVKNTTEGLNIVAGGLDWRDGDNVIIADIEYPSNVYCWLKLEQRGVVVRWVKTRGGRVPVDDVAALIDARTRLVSLSAVQFSTGFRQDIAATGALCRERGVLFNLDAIQWVGALHLDLSSLAVDFLSAGGHKWLLAPIGTGLFYCRREVLDRLDPPFVGYNTVGRGEAHMDYDLVYRDGATRFEEALINFPGIWGLDAAIGALLAVGTEAVEACILDLTEAAIEGLRRRGYDIVSPVGPGERSGIVCFRHPTIPAEAIAERLRQAGVDVAVRGGSLRLSPSYYNDGAEIERFLETLPGAPS